MSNERTWWVTSYNQPKVVTGNTLETTATCPKSAAAENCSCNPEATRRLKCHGDLLWVASSLCFDAPGRDGTCTVKREGEREREKESERERKKERERERERERDGLGFRYERELKARVPSPDRQTDVERRHVSLERDFANGAIGSQQRSARATQMQLRSE